MTSQTIHIYHQQGNGKERIFSLEERNSSFFLHLQENHQREKHPQTFARSDETEIRPRLVK